MKNWHRILKRKFMINAKDKLEELATEVEILLKVIECGSCDVTKNTVAVVNVRKLTEEIDRIWESIED